MKVFFAIMFTGKEKNKLKIEEIRSSPELLRINSRYTGAEVLAKFFLILIVLFLIVFYEDIISLIKGKSLDEQLVLISMAVFFLASVIFTIYKINQNRGKTFIATEKGLFIEPGLAEFWKDIDEYRWNTSAEKDLPFGQSEGTSTLIFNKKGACPKTFDLMQYGIFFTPDQVQQVDNICNRLGIIKVEG